MPCKLYKTKQKNSKQLWQTLEKSVTSSQIDN